MDTFFSEKQRLLKQSVKSFADQEIIPIAKDIDIEQRFPWEVIEKMGTLGYFGIQTPKEFGGAAMDTVDYIIVIEEISKAAASIGLCTSVHNSVALFPILKFGNQEQKEKFVPDLATGKKIGAFCLTEPNAGSDASSIEAVAIKEGNDYIVNANKIFVTNGGVAETCLIFVRTDPLAGPRGISVIIAEKGTSGFVVGENENLSGMRANPVCSIRLSDCRIPKGNLLAKEGMGLKIGLSAQKIRGTFPGICYWKQPGDIKPALRLNEAAWGMSYSMGKGCTRDVPEALTTKKVFNQKPENH